MSFVDVWFIIVIFVVILALVPMLIAKEGFSKEVRKLQEKQKKRQRRKE